MRLRRFKLFVNLKKYTFAILKVKFLGFIILTNRVSINNKRIKTII